MNRALFWICLLSFLVLATTVVSVCIGPEKIPVGDVVRYLLGQEDTQNPTPQSVIVHSLRLPRILLALTIGIGLASAGTGYQGLFRNPLADPFIIGASAGAALGVAIAITQRWEWRLVELGPVFMAAMLGSLLAVMIVYGIATSRGRAPMTELLLAGIVVSSFFSAMVSLVMYQNQDSLIKIFGWLMGSLSSRGWPHFRAAIPMIALGTSLVWICSRGLDSLTFGEETAGTLGVRVNLLRALIVIGASISTASAVAAGGIIAFVGLIAPHIARLLVGARHAVLLPTSCLIGGLMLLIADDIARVAVAPVELPPGVITAFLGGPFFLYLLKTRNRKLEWNG